MKWQIWIIIVSTFLTCSHFLLREFSNEIEWNVWVASHLLGGTSILTAVALYLSVPYQQIGIKLITFIYIFLCIIELIVWIECGSHHQWWPSLIIFGVVCLFVLFKAHQWNLEKIKEFHKPINLFQKEKCYIIFKRPNNFKTWVGSLFGAGIGSLFIVCGGYKYYMSAHHNKFSKKHMIGLEADEVAFEMNFKTNDQLIDFSNYVESKLGTEFSVLNQNCLTVLKEGFKIYGVKVKTFLPSKYFYQFIKSTQHG